MRRGLLVYNPKAGSGERRSEVERILASAKAAGLELAPLPTQRAGHATELVREHLAEGPDVVAVCGGDGTLGEVALAHDVLGETPIAVLPAGTANVIAREYGIGTDLAGAERHLHSAKTRPLSVWNTAGRACIISAGIGFDARVMAYTVPLLKRLFGRTGIGWTATLEWLKYEFPPIEITGTDAEGRRFRREATFAIAANTSRYGGNPIISPHADPSDDLLELVLFTSRSRGSLIAFYGRLSRAKAEHLAMEGVERLAVRDLTAVSKAGYELEVQVDGDFTGWSPMSIAPSGRVNIVVPEKA